MVNILINSYSEVLSFIINFSFLHSLISSMSLAEYWIGDHVIILSKNLRGRFEGIDSTGMAIVRAAEKVILVSEDDLQSYDEPLEEVSIKLIDEDDDVAFKPVKSKEITEHVIDLHYEK